MAEGENPTGTQPEAAKISPEAEFGRLSKKEQVSRFRGVIGDRIIKKLDEGDFNSDPKLREMADTALAYDPAKGWDSGKNLIAEIKITEEMLVGSDGKADLVMQGAFDSITSAAVFKVKGNEHPYSYQEWQATLKALPEDQKAKVEEQTSAKLVFAEKTEGMETANSIIEGEYEKLELKIKDHQRLTEAEQKLFTSLALAKGTVNGEDGVFFSHKALKDLKKAGTLGLDGKINNLTEKADAAQLRLRGFLTEKGVSTEDVATFLQNPDGVIQRGNLPAIDGLDVKIFGREMTEEELIGIFDPQKEKNLKKNALIWLLLASFVPAEVFIKQVLPVPGQQN